MDQIWHRPNLVGPNMAPTKFGWTKNGSDQIWVWTKYGLDQIWARPNMLDQIWSDQKWPTKSVSTKSGLTPVWRHWIWLDSVGDNIRLLLKECWFKNQLFYFKININTIIFYFKAVFLIAFSISITLLSSYFLSNFAPLKSNPGFSNWNRSRSSFFLISFKMSGSG